jgi:hypothetical protein
MKAIEIAATQISLLRLAASWEAVARCPRCSPWVDVVEKGLRSRAKSDFKAAE